MEDKFSSEVDDRMFSFIQAREKHETHLHHAHGERTLYSTRLGLYDNLPLPQLDHFSLDCMEKIQLPYFGGSPQPALTYFLRKFSVTPNGLFDEVTKKGVVLLHSELLGKTNANHILSVLDSGIQEKKRSGIDNRSIVVNLDNWKGNKNAYVAVYLALLVDLGLYDEAEAAFMLPGHTKFSPDRMFAWLSEMLKKRDLFEISDILSTVESEMRIRGAKAQASYKVVSGEEMDGFGNSTFFTDYKSSISHLYHKFRGISKMHRMRARRVDERVIFEVKEFTEDPNWKLIDFYVSLPPGNFLPLQSIPMKAAKVKDLKKYLPFIPGRKLSYIP